MAQPRKTLTFVLLAFASVGVAQEKPNPAGPAHPPWKLQAGYRVLDLSRVPIVIDEPGRYAIDRDPFLARYAPGGAMLWGTSIGSRARSLRSTSDHCNNAQAG